MDNLLNWLDTKYVDFFVFILVIGSGFLQQRLLSPFCWYKKDPRYDATLKTFVVSILLSAIYIWLYKYEANGATHAEQAQGTPWLKMFVSFTVATSFYELIVRLFKIEFKKKTNIDVDEATHLESTVKTTVITDITKKETSTPTKDEPKP